MRFQKTAGGILFPQMFHFLTLFLIFCKSMKLSTTTTAHTTLRENESPLLNLIQSPLCIFYLFLLLSAVSHFAVFALRG